MIRVHPGELWYFLLFHKDTGKLFTSQKITKDLYLPQMMSDPKNKYTLFSSTLKVDEIKVHLLI